MSWPYPGNVASTRKMTCQDCTWSWDVAVQWSGCHLGHFDALFDGLTHESRSEYIRHARDNHPDWFEAETANGT